MLPTAQEDGQAGAGVRILLVEDHADGAWILSRLLGTLGCVNVEIAPNGQTALTKLTEFLPDIVLLDIGLPGMDGYAVARCIREQRQFDDLLLVALTGYGRVDDRRKAAEAGVDIHLLKPAGVNQLQSLLHHPKVKARRSRRSTANDKNGH